MHDSRFMAYPHGYLGAKLLYREPPPPADTAEAFGAMLADGGVIMPDDVGPYNREVGYLTKVLLTGSSQSLTFEYRKRVIKAGLTAWGTQDLGEWYQLQYSSAEFGDIHQRFLDDCFRFIMTGQREIEPEYWYKIMANKTDRTDDPGSISRAAFGTGHGKQAQAYFRSSNAFIPNVIVQWTAQQDGFNDLLMSLNVLFGR